MDDLPPITVTEQNSFCVEMMKRLNIQRKQGHLCDLTLITKDDQEFKAHSNVLSAASPFFCKLFQSDMKENREGVVRFEEVLGSVMEDVLEFIYTGTVEVTEENAEELVAATNYLIVPNLKTISGRYLRQKMRNSSCISTFYFAEKYDCEELVNDSKSFIHANFASVADMDEFLSLEAKEVERWISSDEIVVRMEADVFQIVQKGVEHNKSERKVAFEELLRHVRLVFVSRDYLLNVVTNELVRDNPGCFTLISDAIEQTTFPSDDDLSQSPRKALDTRAIVACGEDYAFCYVPQKDEWKRLPNRLAKEQFDFLSTHVIRFRDQLFIFHKRGRAERKESCVIGSGNFLYLLGGKSPHTSQYVAKADRFDITERKWEEIKDMQQARGGAFGVATQEKIFVAGGADKENTVLKTCEVYNVSSNEWQLIANLNVCRTHGSMVCLGGTLYVLGGCDQTRKNGEHSVECYDSTQGKWIMKTTIPVKGDCKNKHTFKGCVLKFSKGVLDNLDGAVESLWDKLFLFSLRLELSTSCVVVGTQQHELTRQQLTMLKLYLNERKLPQEKCTKETICNSSRSPWTKLDKVRQHKEQ
ncbi:Kelch-like protein 3 [Stylophora pistillata]|uniref:Kelch-like protein 3 n=1 Tax=Stylophora pistillata TaxID=50429 RepID=A0A2B4S7E6_STYPI|nr:Kelch-like protein 3 [Stylophora pistillata]